MTIKKFVSLVLAAVLMVSTSLTALAKTFSDVPASFWGYSYVNDMSDKGVINGYTDGSFKPDATITNAEFVTLLANAYCTAAGLPQPEKAASGRNWYDPSFSAAVTNAIITQGQFSGKESTPIVRSDMALLLSNALSKTTAPADTAAALNKFSDAADLQKLSAAYQAAVAKTASADIITGDDNKNFNPSKTATRAEAAVVISKFMAYYPLQTDVPSPQPSGEKVTLLIAAAASLKNVFDKSLIAEFEKVNPNIKIEGTYDSSGKLQTQIESGLEADVFFSAAAKQMNELKDKNLVDAASVINLLENKLVLITPKDIQTKVTGFTNITEAETIAIGDPASVPAGQYAQEVFTNLGIWDAVLKKSSLGTNVTEVLSWVAQGSADAGVVYATDAASSKDVVVIAEAPAGSLKQPVIYPIGVVSGSKHKAEAQKLIDFLRTDAAKAIFESYGFTIAK